VDDWAKYNYSGYEAKSGWPEARALFDTLATLPPGRVMWEFNRDYERFGTTRTLENIPVFGGQPTMEGLLIESSINAPFHFINQKETSETFTEAVPGVPYPDGFDFPTGLAHLRLFGVRYYVAYDACKNSDDQAVPCADLGHEGHRDEAAAAAGLPVVKRSGRFTIYEVGTGDLVEVPKVPAGAGRRPQLAGQRPGLVRQPQLAGDPAGVRVQEGPGGHRRLRRGGKARPSPPCPGSRWSGRASWPPPPAGPATWSASGPTGSASPTSSRSPGSPTGRSRGPRARGCSRQG
jgi:hypothetical protein